MRALWLLAFLALAPAAEAQELPGLPWASSPAGHLALTTEGNQATFRLVEPDGRVGAAEPLAAGHIEPFVAVGQRGDAVVAWHDDDVVTVRYRPPGEPFGPPEQAATGVEFSIEALPLGIDASGTVTVAWATKDGALHARTRAATGAWGPPQRLGGEHVFRPVLTVTGNGSAILAWRQNRPGGLNDNQIAIATRPPAGAGFGRARVIAGVQRSPSEPVVAANDRGDAVVAWIESHGSDRYGIHGSFRAPGQGFGRPVALSRMQAARPSVAVHPSARMVMSWTNNFTRRVEARVRSSTGALGRPRILTSDLEVNSYTNALPSGRGVIAWSDRDPGVTTIRSVQATDDRRFGPPRILARVRGWSAGPAFGASPVSLALVARPPLEHDDPVRAQPVSLNGR